MGVTMKIKKNKLKGDKRKKNENKNSNLVRRMALRHWKKLKI